MFDFPQWGGKIIDGSSPRGQWISVPAPVGFPPVFYKDSSAWGAQLRDFVVNQGYTVGFEWA